MITEWLLSMGVAVGEWFLGLFGTDDPPTWLADAVAFFSEIIARVSGLGAWVPFGLIGLIGATLLTLWSVFWIVKGIRWLWGLQPLSGGS